MSFYNYASHYGLLGNLPCIGEIVKEYIWEIIIMVWEIIMEGGHN